MMFLLLSWTATVLPYRICFSEGTSEGMFYLELVIDLLFFLDILLTFNSAYYGTNGILVDRRIAIARQYWKSWFLLDFLACVPFQLLESSEREAESGQNYNKLIRIFRLPKLYRLFRVIKLLKMVRVIRSKIYLLSFLGNLKAGIAFKRLLNFIFSTLLLVHFMACLWYYLARIEDNNEDTWIVRHNIIDMQISERYLMAVYWIVVTLTTVGYGDIVPYTNLEKVFATVMMAFGVALFTYLVSNITTVLENFDHAEIFVKARLDSLHNLALVAQLPDDLYERIKGYITHEQQSLKHTNDCTGLIDFLPKKLKEEISQYHFQSKIQHMLFFKSRPVVFLLYVLPKLNTIQYTCKDIIYNEGDYSTEIVFIDKGKVSFRAANLVVFRVYQAGSYFGEIEILNNTTRKHLVQVSSRDATLFLLSRADFISMCIEFPDVAEEIKQISRIRELKHDRAEAKARLLQQPFLHDDGPQFDHTVNFNLPEERNKFLWRNITMTNSMKQVNLDYAKIKLRNSTIKLNEPTQQLRDPKPHAPCHSISLTSSKLLHLTVTPIQLNTTESLISSTSLRQVTLLHHLEELSSIF